MASLTQTLLGDLVPLPFHGVLNFREADRVYEALRQSGGDLLEGLLQHLRVRYRVAPADLAHIPRCGPAVVVANHPYGILEAAVLITALRQIRSDVRILANEILRNVPELHDAVIPVDELRRAARYVRQGGLLIVFPAGAVSHFQWRDLISTDPAWREEVARFLRICNAPAIPVFVPGSNSVGFHAAGLVHPRLRFALLARELFNKKAATVELRIGHPISPDKLTSFATDAERIEYLRWRTYLLAKRQPFAANTRAPFPRARKNQVRPIIDAVAGDLLEQEIERLPADCFLERSGDLQVLLARAQQIPQVLREIGRLREETFRKAGEGTGRELDLDRFDEHYLHLFVWHTSKREVVGASRLKSATRPEDLYTRTLFQFDDAFLRAMGPAIELGRSFIRIEYQKSFSPLLLLWKGIGKFVAANAECKTLFGPVSISNEYQSISRELMISFLEKRASVKLLAKLVRPQRRPGAPRVDPHCQDVEELSEIISDLEPSRPGIPVLLRQYLKLGGKLLGFNVDPEFSNALDGLIVVDLTQTEPRLLERYLGKDEARSFLNFHTRS